MTARRLLILLVAASFLAGIAYAAFGLGGGGLGAAEAAMLLRKRLRTSDRFSCSPASGTPLPGEPAWDYDCVDVTHPRQPAYLVKTSGGRITDLQSSG